ncbi:MAG: NTP transferase domain-containing protein [Dehalococcoidia bacterium]|nr:NTP transferase domain-containing protein [Dehalococcoidia bacterium]
MSGLAAILLAAGASRRMGRPKPLLPWAGATLIEHELEVLRAASVARVAVVVGSNAEAVRRVVGAEAPLVFNARWASGRATSLARGAAALLEGNAGDPPDAVLVQNVDQPTTAEVIAHLLAELRSSGADAVQPIYVDPRDAEGREHGGHPVLLAAALLPDLAAATEEREGLRGVLAGRRVHRVAIEDPTVGLDLDTPEAYEAARAALGA